MRYKRFLTGYFREPNDISKKPGLVISEEETLHVVGDDGTIEELTTGGGSAGATGPVGSTGPAGATGAGGAGGVQQSVVTLTSSDILALNTTPFILVAQAAGTFVRILEIYGQTQGTTPYVFAANLQIVDGGAVSSVNLSGMKNALEIGDGFLSIDKPERDLNTGLTGGTVFHSDELSPKLQAQTSNPTGGDLTLTVTTLYTVVTIA